MIVDLVLAGDAARATDTLIQQYKAIEQAHNDGGWKAARHLSAVPDGRVSVMEDRERDELYQDEKYEMRAKKIAQQVARGGADRGADR